MAHLYITGYYVTNWAKVLIIVYGVLALITLLLATILAYHGKPTYQQMPERYRNRHWVRPLLPILFIILPALLWPLVMVGTGVFILAVLFFDKDDGIWKKMRGNNKEKDVEKGQGTGVSNLNEQSSSEHATTISKPSPTYQPYDRVGRLPGEELAR